jgi:CHAD domain-containing protein
VDTGRIGSGNGAVEFGEVELELKDGPPGPLFALARSLAETERLHVSLVPKSERGYALAEGAAPEPVKAESAELSPEMPASEAFRAIARACLRHFLANERVERLRSDAEAVHQMRVAIRRMRAAMTLFKTVVRDDRTEAIKAGLKGIVGVLGEARDLDVFLATVLMPARRPERQDPELETMIADAQAKRDAAYESLHAMLRSPEFTGTILTVSEWVEAGPWQADGLSEERDGPVARLAAAELQRRWRSVRRRSKRLTRMEDEERHALRIAIKKLRYGIEFFGRLFPGKTMKRRRRKMLGAMEALQEILGELNDIAVAGREDAPPMPEALQRRQKRRAGKLLRAARDEAADMADLAPFWVERGKHRAGAITG